MSSTAAETPRTAAHRRRFTVDALFTDTRARAAGVAELPSAREIRLDRIVPDPAQPRQTFDEQRMAELAASIAAEGVLQPIVVRYDETDDIYVVIHGERRWRASRMARLTSIPAIVRDVPENRRLIHQLMENIVREDLNAVDRAAALRALKTQMGNPSWEEVADAVAVKRSRLFQLLGTEKLPEAIQDDIRAGRLSEKQSRALQGLGFHTQLALRDAILADALALAETQRLARLLRSEPVDYTAEAAALRIAELRNLASPQAPEAAADDDVATLLELIAKAANGDARDRLALAAAADRAWAAPFDPDRLEEQVHGLARTLGRASSMQLRPGSPSYSLLRALQVTLGSLLD